MVVVFFRCLVQQGHRLQQLVGVWTFNREVVCGNYRNLISLGREHVSAF